MTERLLTTHVGSLPRPADVVALVAAADRGKQLDGDRLSASLDAAVAEQIRLQARAGIDLVSDGEMSKIGYATFIRHRLSGFEAAEVPRATPADLDAYPAFRDRLAARGATARYLRPICVGPIHYEHREPLQADLDRLSRALAHQPVTGAFINSPSPGVIALFHPNRYFHDTDSYLEAIGEAMREEYEAIVAAGFVLQIDAPDLAMGRHIMYRNDSDEDFLRASARHVEVLNHALRNVSADRIRLHVCWGNYEGPHHLDIAAKKIAPIVVRSKARFLAVEAANPRHGHDWASWGEARVPDDKVLIPGVIDSTTNYIEDPLLVAERLGRFIDAFGSDRVIAGTDCGFGTWSGFGAVDPDICFAKLAALAEGARIASGTKSSATTFVL